MQTPTMRYTVTTRADVTPEEEHNTNDPSLALYWLIHFTDRDGRAVLIERTRPDGDVRGYVLESNT